MERQWPSTGDLVELGECKWQAKAMAAGLDLVHIVTKGNKAEQARARRLNVQNEVEHRKVEAAALEAQIHALGEELAQVHFHAPTFFVDSPVTSPPTSHTRTPTFFAEWHSGTHR
jgi:lysyl-tRNA synthetase class II